MRGPHPTRHVSTARLVQGLSSIRPSQLLLAVPVILTFYALLLRSRISEPYDVFDPTRPLDSTLFRCEGLGPAAPVLGPGETHRHAWPAGPRPDPAGQGRRSRPPPQHTYLAKASLMHPPLRVHAARSRS